MSNTTFYNTKGYTIVNKWLNSKGFQPFEFQLKSWENFSQDYSGIVVAPTGFGKTYSVFLSVIIDYLSYPENYKTGLKLLWITPLRSLAKDIARAMQEAIDGIGLDWTVGLRNGDTSIKDRKEQIKQMPEILVITPESLHLLFAQKNNADFFSSLKCIAVDEWHELLGTKRGVMVELAISYLLHRTKGVKIWGITATIGNIDEALEVLVPYDFKKIKIIAKEKKQIDIVSVLPDELEVLPWSGHMGTRMVDKIIPIINKSKTTLIFTNTRNQAETWYQNILNIHPDLAGQIAIHHSSIDKELRVWIEDSLSNGVLKAVISTSSLDLGVDFKPVDTVIQIGSSKGVARFLQRAGRSGHSPFEVSTIYFVPTNSLELIEVAALKYAYKSNVIEDKIPVVLAFDVLVQFLVTIAIGSGFYKNEAFEFIKQTHAYKYITNEEWLWVLLFITKGGETFKSYDEFKKVTVHEDGLHKVEHRKIATLHRLNIGAIVSDNMLKVKFIGGSYIGMVEEYFVSRLNEGDAFILAGKVVELVMIKDLTVLVRASKTKNASAPSWMGGRLPLTSYMSSVLRKQLANGLQAKTSDVELSFLKPLLLTQQTLSYLPKENELLVEYIITEEGFQLFVYPFEGRLVHEVMAALIAHRISKITPISFTMAMNDYGFDLLSDQEIPVDEDNIKAIFSKENLMQDVVSSINAAEMAKRKFRDVACISGMVLQTVLGKQKSNKSLHSSSNLIFNVLEEHDKSNLLLRQAYDEVFNQQIEEARLIDAFNRINSSAIIFKKLNKYTPLSFPIKADLLRQSLSTEDLATRLKKMQELNFRIDK